MPKNELVSVIIPVYNVEDYLEKCIQSLVNQTYENIEIILVDDESPDRCGEICDIWAGRDSRIRVIHQKNSGQGGARNVGVSIARGEFITFVDSDDYVENKYIETLYFACKEYDANMSICDFSQLDYMSHRLKTKNSYSGKATILSREEALQAKVFPNSRYHIPSAVWGKMYKYSLVEKLEFPENITYEDTLYVFEAILLSTTIVYIDKPLYVYLVNRPGSSMNISRNYRKILDDMLPQFQERSYLVRKNGFESIASYLDFQSSIAAISYAEELANRKKYEKEYQEFCNWANIFYKNCMEYTGYKKWGIKPKVFLFCKEVVFFYDNVLKFIKRTYHKAKEGLA